MNTKTIVLSAVMVLIVQLIFAQAAGSEVGEMDEYVLLDDFSDETSVQGTGWDGFTDQVMGGVSEMSVVRIPDPDGNYVRMKGLVSTRNNGGFIQIRLKLLPGGGAYDGSDFQGLRLSVRGKGSGYYIFLRTTNTILPWKFFKAAVPVTGDWGVVEVPWTAFGSGDYGREKKLNTDRLKSVALVAYGRDFNAEIDLREIGLYK